MQRRDGLLQIALKTILRLSRVILKPDKRILGRSIRFLTVRSLWGTFSIEFILYMA